MTPDESPRGGFLLGTMAGCCWALPVAWRLDGPSFAVRYLLVAAACTLIAGPLVFALRSRPVRPRAIETAIVLSAALSAAPLTLLGTVLKAQTHHRQLGGATFALLAVVFVMALSLFVARSIQLATRRDHGHSLKIALSVLAGLSLGFCVFQLARATHPLAANLLIEASAGLFVIGVAAKVRFRPPRSLARLGVGLWLVAAMAGVVGARLRPDATRALSTGASLTYGLTISPQK